MHAGERVDRLDRGYRTRTRGSCPRSPARRKRTPSGRARPTPGRPSASPPSHGSAASTRRPPALRIAGRPAPSATAHARCAARGRAQYLAPSRRCRGPRGSPGRRSRESPAQVPALRHRRTSRSRSSTGCSGKPQPSRARVWLVRPRRQRSQRAVGEELHAADAQHLIAVTRRDRAFDPLIEPVVRQVHARHEA